MCEDGNIIHQSCPGGSHYNPELMVCDLPEMAGCVLYQKTTTQNVGQITEEVITVTTENTSMNNIEENENESTSVISQTTKMETTEEEEEFSTTKEIEYSKITESMNETSTETIVNLTSSTAIETSSPIFNTTPEKPKPTPPPVEIVCPQTQESYPTFFPYPGNCAKYFECSNGMSIEMVCPSGLQFNVDLNVCDFPRNVKCYSSPKIDEIQKENNPEIENDQKLSCPEVDGWESVFILHPNDCGKYYECSNGVAIEMSCPKGLHFNTKKNVCDFPRNASCRISEKRIDEENDEEKDSEEVSFVNSEDSVLQPHPDCEDKEEGLSYADSENCSKFFICDNGYRLTFTCPGMLHYNQELKVCDFPKYAGCNKKVVRNNVYSVLKEIEQDEEDEVTQEKEAEEENWSTGKPNDADCLKTEEQFLPDEEDCSKFYQCFEGTKFHKSCPPGLFFNPTLTVCDFPKNSGCRNKQSLLRTLELEENKIIIEKKEKNEEEEWTTGKPNDPDCLKTDKEFLPNKEDCTKFYHCFEGTKFPMTCPSGLHFNPTLNVCDYPKNAGCLTRSLFTSFRALVEEKGDEENKEKETDEEYPGIPNDPDCMETNKEFLPHPKDCTKFYECLGGTKFEKTCPSGLHFNPSLEVCDWPKAAKCTLGKRKFLRSARDLIVLNVASSIHLKDTTSPPKVSTSPPKNPTSTTKVSISPSTVATTTPKDANTPSKDVTTPLPKDPQCSGNGTHYVQDSHDCHKFFECDNGVLKNFTCPAGLFFNPELSICDWNQPQGCVNSKFMSLKRNINRNSTKTTTIPPTTPIPNDPLCSTNATHYLPDPNDCHKFFECDNGMLKNFTCPDGLFFNPVLSVCDWKKPSSCNQTRDEKFNIRSDSECASEGIHYIPDPQNCQSFFECDNGKKQHFTCPGGLFFNPEFQICDWKKPEGCNTTKNKREN